MRKPKVAMTADVSRRRTMTKPVRQPRSVATATPGRSAAASGHCVSRIECRQAGDKRWLQRGRQREPCGAIGAPAEKGDMADGEHAASAAEEAEPEPGDHIDAAEQQELVAGEAEAPGDGDQRRDEKERARRPRWRFRASACRRAPACASAGVGRGGNARIGRVRSHARLSSSPFVYSIHSFPAQVQIGEFI